jgi:hypothetical protein
VSTVIAYALPILPGRTESAADFGAALDRAGLRERYEELNRRAELIRHDEWVQSLPGGDILIVVFETAAPQKLGRKFDPNDEYDNWWRARIRENHGVDPDSGSVLPGITWSWESGSAD